MSTSPQHSEAASADTVLMDLDEIVPYWRNPRRILDEAVNAVAESIRRYGYTQPIVVDSSKTIIIGHARYAALRRMGVTGQIPVKVAADLDPTQVKALRVLDNRTSEYSSWDFEQLRQELGDLDMGLMQAYFPDAGPIDDPGPDAVTPQTPEEKMWSEVDRHAEFICPGCFHSFGVDVTLEAVRSGKLEVPAS
jgi:hypothetical protein